MAVKVGKKVVISLICSGKTISGQQGRYLGWKDEALLESEEKRMEQKRNNGDYPKVSRVYTSSLIRGRQTSHIIYNKFPAIVVNDLADFDMGDFEEKTCDSADQTLISSVDILFIPNGESPHRFSARIQKAFTEILKDINTTVVENVAVISHQKVINLIARKWVVPKSIDNLISVEYGGGIKTEYDYDTEVCRIIGLI